MKLLNKIVMTAALFAAAMGLVSCDKKPTLKLYSWTYYTPTDVVKAFEEEFNCKVIVTEYDSFTGLCFYYDGKRHASANRSGKIYKPQ